jgi:cytochrome c biogenesis protein CcdA
MLQAQMRVRGRRYALGAFAVAAMVLTAWIGLELARLRAGHTGLPEVLGVAGPAGAAFAFICSAVGPSLPYLSAALIPSALAVMAPCLLQMSIVLVTAMTGASAASAASQRSLWREGALFAAGFLGTYAAAALLIGLAGQALAAYGYVLEALGGLFILLLGLAVLRALPRGALSGCRGPRWLVLTGKASLYRPLAAGGAFAVYCVGCCGPYLTGLALLGAGSGSLWGGAGLVLTFALLMGALLLLPIFALPLSRRLSEQIARRAGPLTLIAGTVLVAVGTLLALKPLVVWALTV